MTLLNAKEATEYTIKSVDTKDEDMNSFLFSLGCYSGEPITVIRKLRGGLIVSIKDSRYSIDKRLADTIAVCV